MTEPPLLVFVYGTLMRGLSRHHYMTGGDFDGEASAEGRLISLGGYPARVDGEATVRGELYAFDDLPVALDVLDEVEGFDPANPDESEYVREARGVRRDDGSEIIAWLYVYNRPFGNATVVKSGDWKNRG